MWKIRGWWHEFKVFWRTLLFDWEKYDTTSYIDQQPIRGYWHKWVMLRHTLWMMLIRYPFRR
jgi:hypothetical protein